MTITPKELKALYPYQFEGPHIELSFFRGWMAILARLCADVDKELGQTKRNFRWVQLKQKFGSARFYSQMDALLEPDENLSEPDEMALRQRIQKLRLDAESITQGICIVCGEPGEVDGSTGIFLVVCPEHARQHRRGDMESPWFSEEEVP